MFCHYSVQESKKISRRLQRLKGSDESILRDVGFKQILWEWSAPHIGTRTHSRPEQIVKGFTRPIERSHYVLLVESRTFMKFTSFAVDKVLKFTRQQQLNAEVFVLQLFVVEQRPNQLFHAVRLTVDQIRFIDTIDDHDHAGKSERPQ